MQNLLLIVFFCSIFSIAVIGNSFADNYSINVDSTFYEKADIISIWGSAPPNPQNTAFVSIKDPNDKTVWTEKLSLDEKGEFST